jgi:uncharacterized protein
MQKDQVYKVTFQPMQTSFYFAAGDQLRVEISSSNFPLSDRNLNTGGENYNEWKGQHNLRNAQVFRPSLLSCFVL